MSEEPWRKAHSRAEAASYERMVRPGDANLQQTSALGPGDGCGIKPEGNANEIQGVVAECYKGRPDSDGSSLDSMSRLQSSSTTSPTSILPQTSTHFQLSKKPLGSQVACCPPEKTTFKGQSSCGEMDESEGLEGIPRACVMENATAPVQHSRLSSLFSKVSWIVQDAGHLLWQSPTVLQQVRQEGLQPVGARLSSHVVSLVRESNVLSVVKNSPVFSIVKGSFVFSLLQDSHIFSLVKGLPLMQHIQTEITQHLQLEEVAQIIRGCINPDTTQLPVLTPTQTLSKTEILPADMSLISGDVWVRKMSTGDLLQQDRDMADIHSKQKQSESLIMDKEQKLEVKSKEDVKIFSQTLIEFPEFLSNLQNLPLSKIMDALHSVISTSVLTPQKIVAFYCLNVAKCSQPEPRPALLILMETGLYTLTIDSGRLVLFHHLPLLQLKEVQIGLAGHILRLMGTTEESILGVYTHSQKITKELCWAILGIICPGDSRVSHHPLLQEDLMKMSLNWHNYVPDLLLDAGLRVCCQFQKSLADLVYLLHCNMNQSEETVSLGEVQILLYTSVGVCMSPSTNTRHLSQLLVTDTHLGLLQEDAVFHPSSCSILLAPCRPQFHDLILRPLSAVRGVLVSNEDERGAVGLDIILTTLNGRGHSQYVPKEATLPAQVSDSSLHAEVWKLTFSCSTEADCLINHLSMSHQGLNSQ